MEPRNNTDQMAEELIQNMFTNEYERMVRYASICLKAGNKTTYVASRAEDVVQETFTQVWLKREEVLACQKPVGWVYNAIKFKSKEMKRKEYKWAKRLLQYKLYYQDQTTEPHVSVELELQGLVPKEDFDLLHKLYVEGYSYKELCQVTGLTKSALATRVNRTKRKILKKLME